MPIAPTLLKELKAWKLRCPDCELDLVFPNSKRGVSEYVHVLRCQFFPRQIAAGVCVKVSENEKGEPILKARYGFHDLRHAAASAWIKQRIDLKRLDRASVHPDHLRHKWAIVGRC